METSVISFNIFNFISQKEILFNLIKFKMLNCRNSNKNYKIKL